MRADDVGSVFGDVVRKAFEERGHVNVLIAGRSGVGKSTLINAVFQGSLAETGQGRPVTKETREITKEGLPLSLFDTRGLEMVAYQEALKQLETFVAGRRLESDPNRRIHVAWLCIHEDGRRVEDAEVQLCQLLAPHVPVVGVITKARQDGGFRASVQQLLPLARNVVRVRALAEELDDGHALPPKGLEELVQLTSEVVPEGQRRAFAAAQKASVALKISNSQKVVAGSVALAMAAAASPIPFSDAALLVPIQVGMLAGISATFGLEISNAVLATLVAAVFGAGGAAIVGRAVVAWALKLLPGVGSAAGGVIAAATAATLTTSLGEAYITTLEKLFIDNKGETPTAEQVAAAFKSKMTS